MSSAIDQVMEPYMLSLAGELGIEMPELLSPAFRDERHVQRRAAELTREKQWMGVFYRARELDERQHTSQRQVRLLEGTGALARAYMQVCPTDPIKTVSDAEMTYALRNTFLSDFPELSHPSGTCPFPGCNQPDGPMHHLSCPKNQSVRTQRHTVFKKLLVTAMRRAKCADISVEQFVGNNNRGEACYADMVASIKTAPVNFDITIGIPDFHSYIRLPTDNEIAEELAADENRPHRSPIFFWEDFSSEIPHPMVAWIRKFREMLKARTVTVALNLADQRKYNKYNPIMVYPLAFTSGGYPSTNSRALMDDLCQLYDPSDLGKQAFFRKDVLGSLSATLIKASARAAFRCRNHSLIF